MLKEVIPPEIPWQGTLLIFFEYALFLFFASFPSYQETPFEELLGERFFPSFLSAFIGSVQERWS